jgi:hypothetical protein
MIIIIAGYHAEIVIEIFVIEILLIKMLVIEILVVDGSSASLGAGRKRRRRSAARSCHDLQRQRVISMKNPRSD